jgi:hypothetical protein
VPLVLVSRAGEHLAPIVELANNSLTTTSDCGLLLR